MSDIKVSILVLTFNHESFVAQCLDSILKQELSFPIEIVVSNDASIDKTRDICQKYADSDERIKFFDHEHNLGVASNFEFAITQCSGEYVAFCEGDDYWLDTTKLAQQIEALDLDAKSNIVYGDYGQVDADGTEVGLTTLEPQPEKFSLTDLIDKHGPSMNTMMIRRSVIPETLPRPFFSVLNPDIFILAWALKDGYGIFIPKTLSMYRKHEGGIWSTLDPKEKKLIQLSTRLIVFSSLGVTYSQTRNVCLEKFEQLLAKTYDSGEFALYKQYLPLLPLRNRIKFQARRTYYRLFNR